MARQTVEEVAQAILDGRAWQASALAVERHDGRGLSNYGILPSKWVRLFDIDAPSIVVYSYVTPIAWRAANGTWRIPKERYSVTTSKHQGLVRRAIDYLGHKRREDDAIEQALDLVAASV